MANSTGTQCSSLCCVCVFSIRSTYEIVCWCAKAIFKASQPVILFFSSFFYFGFAASLIFLLVLFGFQFRTGCLCTYSVCVGSKVTARYIGWRCVSGVCFVFAVGMHWRVLPVSVKDDRHARQHSRDHMMITGDFRRPHSERKRARAIECKCVHVLGRDMLCERHCFRSTTTPTPTGGDYK